MIPGYSLYNTNHPDGTAHGGSAILINTSIRHVLAEKYEYDEIQATTITADDEDGKLTISAIYSPTKHNIKTVNYSKFFKSLEAAS